MQEPHRPDWKDFPTAAWTREGLRYLKDELGTDEEAYRSKLKKHLFASMTLAYWRSMVRHAEENGLVQKKTPDELTEEAIARQLGLNPAQPGRWATGKTKPDADKVFGALLIVLRRELDEAGLPKNREVGWQMACRTITLIRKEDCKEVGPELRRDELSCVWWLVRHPQSDVLLGRSRPVTMKEIYKDVLGEVSRHFPAGTFRSVAEVERPIDRWLYPYLLFHVGLMAGWEHNDDEAF